MTFDLLPKAIAAFARAIPEETNKVTKEIALVILRTAAANTPVDTTKALSNWVVSVGNKSAGEREALVPGIAGSTKPASLAIARLNAYTKLAPRKFGQPIHISNDASYIEGLNNETLPSVQPGFFVEKALSAGRDALKNAKLNIPGGG